MVLYEPIYDLECAECEGTPVVGFRDDFFKLRSTGRCGPCFFQDRAMADSDLWNDQQEDTE